MTQEIAKPETKSVVIDMANRFGMDSDKFLQTLKGTVIPSGATNEQVAAFLLVARDYKLNPLTKEIYAFPSRGGGIQPIVSVDGWLNMVNSNPAMDGVQLDELFDDQGKITAVRCTIWRKDRSHPTVITEYMAECKRDTDTWKKYPVRMLRHKALMQCARVAFGFAGIMDEDEFDRIKDSPQKPVADDINLIIDNETKPKQSILEAAYDDKLTQELELQYDDSVRV